MKALFINGSPRKNGRTAQSMEDVYYDIKKTYDCDIERIDIADINVNGCINCDACKFNGGICSSDDDTNYLMDKIENADILIVGTPVYFWGISSQLKAVLDKMYCREDKFKTLSKKAGYIITGEADLDDIEYELISKQLGCICGYFGWQIIIKKVVPAK